MFAFHIAKFVKLSSSNCTVQVRSMQAYNILYILAYIHDVQLLSEVVYAVLYCQMVLRSNNLYQVFKAA